MEGFKRLGTGVPELERRHVGRLGQARWSICVQVNQTVVADHVVEAGEID
jgi:hypothetical protein